jgi:hypothetical protein
MLWLTEASVMMPLGTLLMGQPISTSIILVDHSKDKIHLLLAMDLGHLTI